MAYTPAMFREDFIIIIRKGIEISIIFKGNEVLSLLIDPHDNRITGCDFDGLLSLSATDQEFVVDKICSYLKEKCGGKEFLFLPSALSQLFQKYGFISSYNELPPEKQDGPKRARFVTAKKLAEAKLNYPSDAAGILDSESLTYTFSAADRKLFRSQKEGLLALAVTSGFSPQKVKDYAEKAGDGMLLAFTDDANLPFALVNAEGEIFACCRITILGNGFGYMGDTFANVDFLQKILHIENAGFAKAIGTYLLYREIGKYLQRNSALMPQTLLLIDPPPYKFKLGEKDAVLDRVEEFDRNFGCQPLSELQKEQGIQALMSFDSPKNDLQQAFNERVRSVKEQPTQPAPQKSFA
jgi:hypothetical protein